MSEYVYATNGEPVANIDGSISLAREEIVRCRDCVHWRTWDCSSIYGNHERDRHACFRFVDGWRMETDSTDFCSFGERKEGGE